jgi:hypothetical protein
MDRTEEKALATMAGHIWQMIFDLITDDPTLERDRGEDFAGDVASDTSDALIKIYAEVSTEWPDYS